MWFIMLPALVCPKPNLPSQSEIFNLPGRPAGLQQGDTPRSQQLRTDHGQRTSVVYEAWLDVGLENANGVFSPLIV